MIMRVTFKDQTLHVHKLKYLDGSLCLRLVNPENGYDVVTATTNLNGVAPTLHNNEVYIKNWSENKGVLEALIAGGVVKDTGIVLPTGFVEANLCEYTGE